MDIKNVARVLYDVNRCWRRYMSGDNRGREVIGTSDALGEAADLISEMADEIERITMERDTAIEQLARSPEACSVCIHGDTHDADCNDEFGDNGCVFEWCAPTTACGRFDRSGDSC